MPDWDKDSSQLQKNLRKAVETARHHARTRGEPSLDQSRHWHTDIMRGLQVSPDARRSWVGHFRGETGQEMVRVHVGGYEGTAPSRVADELNRFEEGLKTAVNHLMTQIDNEKENRQSQTRHERHVEIFFTGKTGFLGKVFVVVTFVVLLPIAFFFSLLLFSVLFVLALLSLGYAWWTFHKIKRISAPPTQRTHSP